MNRRAASTEAALFIYRALNDIRRKAVVPGIKAGLSLHKQLKIPLLGVQNSKGDFLFLYHKTYQ